VWIVMQSESIGWEDGQGWRASPGQQGTRAHSRRTVRLRLIFSGRPTKDFSQLQQTERQVMNDLSSISVFAIGYTNIISSYIGDSSAVFWPIFSIIYIYNHDSRLPLRAPA
jgi:hypothetical protein